MKKIVEKFIEKFPEIDQSQLLSGKELNSIKGGGFGELAGGWCIACTMVNMIGPSAQF